MVFEVAAQIGDFLAGTVGIYLLIVTLREQRASFASQDNKHSIERFESRFFEMIGMHRENVSDLQFSMRFIRKGPEWKFKKRKFEKKQVFIAILDQFYTLNIELRKFIRDDSIFKEEYLKKLTSNPRISSLDIYYFSIARIDICYSILYYGVGSEGVKLLRAKLKSRYNDDLIDFIVDYIRLKPKSDEKVLEKWKKLQTLSDQEKREVVSKISQFRKGELSSENADEITRDFNDNFTKYYGGHQFRLGHYFRHLSQTVKFINEFDLIDYPTRYKYAKMVRAQLSTAEQSLLFLSSISHLGMSWDMTPDVNAQLITKYNLIKNIPGEMTQGYSVARFYPKVEFEGMEVERDNRVYK